MRPPQSREEEDPDPEFTCTDTGKIRIPRVDLCINIIPDKRASTLRTDRMEHGVAESALRAGEGLFRIR